MKTLITLLLLCCASLCWGQFPISFQVGSTDDTANLGTVSHWKALPNGGGCQLLNIDSYGAMLCQGYDGYPYQRIGGATTWTKLASLGNQMHVVMDGAGITYGLGPGGLDWGTCHTLTNTYSILVWSGTAWVAKHGCLSQMAATSDGSIVGTNLYNDTWISSDQGDSWTQISGHSKGPNLSYVSAAKSDEICGTDGSNVYLYAGGGGFVALPAQPATSGIAGCVVTNDAINMYAWGTFGVQRYDFVTGTWNAVIGLSVTGMSAGYNPMTVAIDSAGHPYHLNIFPGFISATLTGQQGCPPGFQCVSTTHHHSYIQVYLPHGQAGQQVDQRVLYNANMNVTAYDYAPACDPIFGATQTPDPECQAALLSSVICESSGQNLTAGQTPTPPVIGKNWSEWVGSYSGSYVIENTGFIFPNSYVASISCAAVDTCRPPTSARCAPPLIEGIAVEGGECIGNGCSTALAVKAAIAGCKSHSITGGPPGAWGWFSNYSVVNGNVTCHSVYGWDAKPYIDPCY